MTRPRSSAVAVAITVAWALWLAPPAAAEEPLVTGSVNGIAYASGGVGDDSLRAVRAVRDQYPLALLFAERSGDYLANIPVHIDDASGRRLFEATADGPFLLVRLPAGRYRVTASHAGQPISRRLSVPAQGTVEESFVWPAAGR